MLTWKLQSNVNRCVTLDQTELNLLVINFLFLITLSVVNEEELPVLGDLSDSHYTSMQTAIRGVGNKHDSLLGREKRAEVGKLLCERRAGGGCRRVLVRHSGCGESVVAVVVGKLQV